jgi:7-cyano-7-deazaguanine synthase
MLIPLIELKKTEIIKLGNNGGVPCEKTWSCYVGSEVAAGDVCDSCELRLAAFNKLGLQEPLPYAPNHKTER